MRTEVEWFGCAEGGGGGADRLIKTFTLHRIKSNVCPFQRTWRRPDSSRACVVSEKPPGCWTCPQLCITERKTMMWLFVLLPFLNSGLIGAKQAPHSLCSSWRAWRGSSGKGRQQPRLSLWRWCGPGSWGRPSPASPAPESEWLKTGLCASVWAGSPRWCSDWKHRQTVNGKKTSNSWRQLKTQHCGKVLGTLEIWTRASVCY